MAPAADARDIPTRLSAIVFTDIAGYSRMMEENEKRTIEVLGRHNDIVLPLIESAGGEVIDAIGDGLFVLFPSVREAVTCSLAIHDAVAAYNEQAPENARFKLRIGVNLGEVWREGDRVYGNGVNVAARVQPLAAPGGICITEDVYRQVRHKIDHEIESIGRHELRNISRRIELFRVVTGHEEALAESPRSEFDAIKQRILQERATITEQRATNPESPAGPESPGKQRSAIEQRIESKVFSVVERVMDRALDTWESMPEEQKQKAVQRLREEADQDDGGRRKHAEITLVEDKPRKKKSRDKRDRSDITSKFATGVAAGTGFGLGYFAFGIGWMVWPFLFFGVFPVAAGIVQAIGIVGRRRADRRERPRHTERQLLDVATRLGGTVTVVGAAREANLELDDVQSTLDRMTAKGYVVQRIRPDGVIEYEFPLLASPSGDEVT